MGTFPRGRTVVIGEIENKTKTIKVSSRTVVNYKWRHSNRLSLFLSHQNPSEPARIIRKSEKVFLSVPPVIKNQIIIIQQNVVVAALATVGWFQKDPDCLPEGSTPDFAIF
jgi:hypothetical protein